MHQFAPPNSMADRTEAMNPALSVQVPVKRKRRREKKSLPMDASELKQIDPNWLDLLGVVTEGKIEETDERIVVQAHVEFDVMPPCTKCHSNGHVTKWDFRDSRNIKDAERNIKRVLIVLVVQRFFCASCDKAFTPLLSFLERGRLSRTERLNDYAKARGFERRTSSDVAALSGLNRRTVQNIQREAAQSMPTLS